MIRLPRTRSCYVCGVHNAAGFRLEMHTDGKIAEARFAFRSEHVGFRDTVHGGLIATILDELMVWACGVATRRFAYCAEMNVRFRKPVRPAVEMVATAELEVDRKGRVLLARSSLVQVSDGVMHAEATGKYMPMGGDLTEFMGVDFVDDLSAVFPPVPGSAGDRSNG